jgi:hypothetical protein
MTKLSWQGILESQQKDFIQRLKAWLNGNHPESQGSSVTLSRLDYNFSEQCESYYSEAINIYYPFEYFIGLDDFCQEMANYYYYYNDNKNYEYEDCYANYMMGKIGEKAVKICLGNLISDMDCQIHEFGDGGSDFSLTSNKNIKLQVKTRARARILQRQAYEMNEDSDWYYHDCSINSQDKINEIDNIAWSISKKEATNNKVLVCVLMLNTVAGSKIICEEYSLLIAGFKPTDMINNSQSIKMKELFYGGGIRSYLESPS